VLLAATAVSATGSIPEISESTCGITLLASSGSQFTKVTGEWEFGGVNSGEGENPGVEFFTQFVAVDLFPVPFGPFGEIPAPLPPICPDFLQVGVNVTEFFTEPEIVDTGNPFAWAFYTWNNVTTNITDASGNLIEFVPGETVTVTLLLGEDGTSATVFYNSTVQGLIEFTLTGGSLCLGSVQWAFGTSTSMEALFGAFDFRNSTATEVDIATGDVSILGPDSGDQTAIWSPLEGIYYEPFNADNQGFVYVAEPDC